MNIFTEANGSLTSGYLTQSIQKSGHKAVGSDTSDFNHGKLLCDDFVIMPRTNDPALWSTTLKLLKKHNVNIVIPSLDDTMVGWAERVKLFSDEGIQVIISPLETISTFQDKWETYGFFSSINIPTPKTSLQNKYELIKPRLGRGGTGIFKNDYRNSFSMDNYISQEIIKGVEYTVDVFFSKNGDPVYIVPRTRLGIKDGKSTKGIVINNPEINKLIIKISENIKFIGPINFQLFETKEKELILIEVNPRIAGGMALGFAATENWINLIINNIVNEEKIIAKPINYGLKMVRYYDECFI